MKSTLCSASRLLAKATLLFLFFSVTALRGSACGPFWESIPTPSYFFSANNLLSTADCQRQENLRLWQQLTSPDIPLSDIEQFVYRSKSLPGYFYTGLTGAFAENKMWWYLVNTDDSETLAFLATAKAVENVIAEHSSPWYYPSDRFDTDRISVSVIPSIIESCRNYSGTRLKDRYSLQAVRALHMLQEYADCINYADTAFADFPDSNLFKRMALDYAAGAWARLGERERAAELFTRTGNYRAAINYGDKRSIILSHPDAVGIMGDIQASVNDSLKMAEYDEIAAEVIRQGKTAYPGDWYFLRAFVAADLRGDNATAAPLIRRALSLPFSSDDFRDHARAFSIKVNTTLGNTSSLLSDLKWMESKIKLTDSKASVWQDIIRNIIYADAVPGLWKSGNYHTAIMLCAYADNSFPSRNWRDNPYSSLSFQMMQSLTSDQMIDFNRQLHTSTPLTDFLRPHVLSDPDLINDLIGTLALREENYTRAMTHLALVSTDYERSMNIYPYLRRNPHISYPARIESRFLPSADRAKFNFAKQMDQYRRTMTSSPDPDLRARARLDYAIGLRNAQTDCWALTKYWNADYFWTFAYPYTSITRYDERIDYNFLQTHATYRQDFDPICYQREFDEIELRYAAEVIAALRSFQSPETKAEALYLLNDLPTVVACYPSTPTAAHIRSSCDRWQSWL